MSKQVYYITDDVQINVESYHERRGEPHKSKNKIYMWPDETVWENLQNRRSRPHSEWKKEMIPMVMDWLKEKMPNH